MLSETKSKYLKFLEGKKLQTSELARKFNVCYRSAYNRLNELQKLELVRRNPDKTWEIVQTRREIVVK